MSDKPLCLCFRSNIVATSGTESCPRINFFVNRIAYPESLETEMSGGVDEHIVVLPPKMYDLINTYIILSLKKTIFLYATMSRWRQDKSS